MHLATLARAARKAAISSVALLAAVAATAARAQTCDPATSGLGAHNAHTKATASYGVLSCTECHPAACTATPSNVAFGDLARKGGATPAWDPVARTCSGVYCHGATLAEHRGSFRWEYVAAPTPTPAQCGLCHGNPPAAPHFAATACNGCHPDTVKADGSIDLAGGRHINGAIDASGGTCGSCHGLPPATGAHVAHFGLTEASPGYSMPGYADLSTLETRYPSATPTGAPAVYAFGCGNCHPALSPAHMDSKVDVVLYEAGIDSTSIKSRNAPTAAYDPVAKTCNGVYCHSSGQAGPAYAATPGWFSGTKVGCNGCHANPPAYPSGGGGTATANSHVNLAEDGYEFGHFLGMPGPTHTSKHGGGAWGPGEDASPITCQTCHFDTTDPANTGPSGFYYLDTSGNYALPGGDPGRTGWQASIQCGACHTPGSAAGTGTGKVLPLRHVNGKRDVVFDPRTALPAIAWLPAAPNRPTRPNWLTNGGSPWMAWPATVTYDGTTVSYGVDTIGYDPLTKTCSNAACHGADTQLQWGEPYVYAGSVTCNSCHPM